MTIAGLSAPLLQEVVERKWSHWWARQSACCIRPRPPSVPAAAGKQNVVALARSNAYLRRTDLLCELIGAVIFGWIYSKGGLPASMAFTAAMSALAAPLQLFFIRRIAALAPSAMLHGRSEPGAGWARLPTWRALLENARLRCSGAGAGRVVAGRVGRPSTAVPACFSLWVPLGDWATVKPPCSRARKHACTRRGMQGRAVRRLASNQPSRAARRLQEGARSRGGGAPGAPAAARPRAAGPLA